MKYNLVNLGQVEAVWNKLGDEEGVARFLSGELVITPANKPAPPADLPEIIFLPVDYTKSLEEMIATGRYDWKNNDITAKRFLIIGNGIEEFEFDLYHPDRSISSEDAIKGIHEDEDPENPWIVARIEHLLAYGVAFPEGQRKFPISALGSVAELDGRRRVPCLD